MDTARDNSPENGEAPVALIALTVLVYAAGFAMVAAWFALVLVEPPAQNASRSTPTCSVCGVVERVGEFERASFSLNGDKDEGIIRVLAQLSGFRGDGPGRVYETAVLHDDGSVRVVRDASVPQWKQGDRVRVVRGRVEPVALGQAPGN